MTMTKITITEALAEIKLITQKLAKKRAFVLDNLVRPEHVPDANMAKGGTPVVIAAEVQSIGDLEARLATIRTAIMAANLTHYAEVAGESKSIYEWLTWKREVAVGRAHFFEQIYSQTKRKMDQLQTQPQVYKNDTGTPVVVKLEAALPYMEFAERHGKVADILNKLDGVLSLKNATIVIEV